MPHKTHYRCVCACVCVCVYSVMSDSVTPWTVAHQAPLWDFPGKNTGGGCHFLLQGIYPTQELNWSLLHLLIGTWVRYHWTTWEALNLGLLFSNSNREWGDFFTSALGKYRVWVLSHFSHVQLFVTLRIVAHKVPLSMGFSRQEYWNELPYPSPGDLPEQGTEPGSLTPPALAGRFVTISSIWEDPGKYH